VWADLRSLAAYRYVVIFRAALQGGDYDVFRREELRAELAQMDADADVELDLSTTTFMDAGAVGLLIAFRRRVLEKNRNARVRLIGATPIVRRVLQLSKAEELFDFTS
jgi:anti-anti-sigma factor